MDDYFNRDVTASGVKVFLGVDECCGFDAFEPHVSTVEGTATFTPFGVTVAGTHVLVVRLYGREEGKP